MNFVIITHVPHILEQNQYFAYAPYVREMNIWTKYADKVTIVAPEANSKITNIDIPYHSKNIDFVVIDGFDVLNWKAAFTTFFKIPSICWHLFLAMKKADHIHLRCPGNIGLLGCMVQIFFPNKSKTAKYAGNWDPNSKQPWSYQLQKWILGNSFLTRNMQVLVYGKWEGSSKNIKPFFTATYSEADKQPIIAKDLQDKIRFVFVGTLSANKNPIYAVQLVEKLFKKGHNVALTLYGEGAERSKLEDYILQNNLENTVSLVGNQDSKIVREAYQNSHFVVLPSQSEGWPKAIAEGMFWGCIPVATTVSCVPFMLDYGNRGVVLEMDLEKDSTQLEALLLDQINYKSKSKNASDWSRKYTLDAFELEIKKLMIA